MHGQCFQGKKRPGCVYIEHPDVVKGGRVKASTYGYWYYLEAEKDRKAKPPREDYEWHVNRLKERRQNCLRDEIARQEAEIERKREEAEAEQTAGVAK